MEHFRDCLSGLGRTLGRDGVGTAHRWVELYVRGRNSWLEQWDKSWTPSAFARLGASTFRWDPVSILSVLTSSH